MEDSTSFSTAQIRISSGHYTQDKCYEEHFYIPGNAIENYWKFKEGAMWSKDGTRSVCCGLQGTTRIFFTPLALSGMLLFKSLARTQIPFSQIIFKPHSCHWSWSNVWSCKWIWPKNKEFIESQDCIVLGLGQSENFMCLPDGSILLPRAFGQVGL